MAAEVYATFKCSTNNVRGQHTYTRWQETQYPEFSLTDIDG